jgi:Zn ribbon nucleic-acid-binding protein
MSTKTNKCPFCEGRNVIKKGTQDGLQTYKCTDCGKRFRTKRKEKDNLIKEIWNTYVFHKQTIRELKDTYHKDKKTIVSYLEAYIPPNKKHTPRPIHLVVDATYFGMRTDGTSWCIVVFRDPKEKENLWWTYGDTETQSLYQRGREELERLGYIILSVTGDGFSGLRSAFFGIPFQMCHVHMERIIIRATTRNPKLIESQVLLALIKTLFDTDEETFKRRFATYIEKYRDFLNERARSESTGSWWYVHDEVRKAVFSLQRLLPYLFTYTEHIDIPHTTNSLEGHFRHINEVVAIHCGLSKPQKMKVLDTIMLEGSIVQKKKKGI